MKNLRDRKLRETAIVLAVWPRDSDDSNPSIIGPFNSSEEARDYAEHDFLIQTMKYRCLIRALLTPGEEESDSLVYRDPNCDTSLDRDARNMDILNNRPEEME